MFAPLAAKPADTPWSALALGCEPLGGTDWGPLDLPRVRDAVRCALECGISVFDTADAYGLGLAEEELSTALGADRHRVTIVTKGGVRWRETGKGARARIEHDASAAYLSSAIDASLKRLRVDAIPLYLVHWPDPTTPIAETLACLERARLSGKIVSYGLSNFSLDAVRVAVSTGSISAIEGPLNILSPDSLLQEFASAKDMGLRTLTYGPLAQGLLTGKYSPESQFDPLDRRHRLKHFSRDAFQVNRPVLDAMREIAREVGRSLAQVGIRWVIDSGVSSSVIVGAKSPAQVLENWGALSWSLGQEQLEKLKAARDRSGIS